MQDVSASWNELLFQAPATVETYAHKMDTMLKDMYPKLSDKERAALLPALVASCCTDFATTALVVASQNIRDGMKYISDSIDEKEFA